MTNEEKKIVKNIFAKHRKKMHAKNYHYHDILVLDDLEKAFLNNKDIKNLQKEIAQSFFIVSNRGDGKTFTFNNLFLDLAKELERFAYIQIVRHSYARFNIEQTINQIILDLKVFKEQKDIITTRDNVATRFYDKNGHNLMMIIDLDHAADLKNISAILKDYSLITYDEFITIEKDYWEDEFFLLKTIYDSIDRRSSIRFLENPLNIYLGNAMNLSSPIIAGYDLYTDFSNAKINTPKKIKLKLKNDKKLNAIISLQLNTYANQEKTGAFDVEGLDDGSIIPDFNFNNFMIEKISREIDEYITIAFNNFFINVFYKNEKIILEYSLFSNNYQYALKYSDLKENVRLLKDDKYLLDDEIKASKVKFANTFSGIFLDENKEIYLYNFKKMLRENKIYNRKTNNQAEKIQKEKERIFIEKTFGYANSFNL